MLLLLFKKFAVLINMSIDGSSQSYLNVSFTELLDVNVSVVISKRIYGRSSKTEPSDKYEKLCGMQNTLF